MDALDKKIRQMYAALDGTKDGDVSQIVPESGITSDGGHYIKIDFNQGSDPIQLANIASLLVNNIACMKDHLKKWCADNNRAFCGDQLIDSNLSVALVHDMWNVEKHADLNRPPRSEHKPRLSDFRKVASLSSGTEAGSMTYMTFDPVTRQMKAGSTGGGFAGLAIHAQFLDSDTGAVLGDFVQICEQAVDAWEKELRLAGVPIPR
jgi:hypothetical protein